MNKLVTTSALLLFAATAWSQQTGNPAGMSPDTPGARTATPPPNHANAQDQLFVRQATLGGKAEVELGKLAQSRAQNAQVKAFAERMVNDHREGNQRLAKLAKGDRITLPEEPLTQEHQNKRSELSKLRGADFDIAYLQAQVADHQKTAHLLQWQISNGQSDELKTYSKEQLPKVLAHLEHAKELMANLTQVPHESRAATNDE